MAEHDEEIDRKLDEILAKDDTAIMLDELRVLFGADIDVDSRFTTAQILTAMERSFEQGKAHIEMLHRAQAAALTPSSAREEELRERLKAWALEKSSAHHKLAVEDEHLRTEHIASSAAYRELAYEIDAALQDRSDK